MIQTKDVNGNRVQGVFRTSDGALVVDDPVEFSRRMSEAKRIQGMESELSMLKADINTLKVLLNTVIQQVGK